MRWGFVVVCLLGACDYVFTIKAPPDGAGSGVNPDGDPGGTPAKCPAIGTAPTFSTSPVLLRSNLCAYTESRAADLAVGDCIGGDGEGKPGSALATALPIAPQTGVMQNNFRLAPEGDRLLVFEAKTTDLFVTVQLYTRVNDRWENPSPLPITRVDGTDRASAPSALPTRRVIVAKHDLQPGSFEEWRDLGDGTWDTPHSYTPDMFGVAEVGEPGLSADGKRLVFIAVPGPNQPQVIYYADRASVDDPFTTAQLLPIMGEMRPLFPFLTSDCSRLYLAGVQSLEWVEP